MRPRRCLSVGQFENAPPPPRAYAFSGYSNIATSVAPSSVATGSPLVTSCLTLGIYLGNGDLFLLFCRLCLVVARVFPTMDFMRVFIVRLFDFQNVIHALVTRYYFLHINPLPVVVNMNIKVLPYDAHHVHYFSNNFTPIVMLLHMDE